VTHGIQSGQAVANSMRIANAIAKNDDGSARRTRSATVSFWADVTLMHSVPTITLSEQQVYAYAFSQTLRLLGDQIRRFGRPT